MANELRRSWGSVQMSDRKTGADDLVVFVDGLALGRSPDGRG